MSVQKDYQMVMAIVNNGFTDLVMNAAKNAGARGGTIMTAHGTGNKEIEKFFGVVVTPEKEIVMILVPSAIKDQVMELMTISCTPFSIWTPATTAMLSLAIPPRLKRWCRSS